MADVLPLRELWESPPPRGCGHDLSGLSDDDLIEAAQILIEEYGTVSPGFPARQAVLDEIRARRADPVSDLPTLAAVAERRSDEVASLSADRVGPSPHRPLGWRSIAATNVPPSIDPVELLDYERAHPDDTSAKWRQIRVLFGRSRSQYLLRLIGVCEDPQALRTHPDVVHRVLQRRDQLRARTAHPAGSAR